MYNTGNEIDNRQKVKLPIASKEPNSNSSAEAIFRHGLACLGKDRPEEALHYFLNAIDFGYSGALLPAILLEIGSDIPEVQSRSLCEVLKLIEIGHAGGDEVATLILAHWNINWSIGGNGIKLMNLDTFEISSQGRRLSPIEVDDVPELQVMSLSRLDRMISSFGLRTSSMGYLSDRVNTEYAIELLKQLLQKGERKAFAAEKYLYYILTDNYELWIDKLLPWLENESYLGNVHAMNLLSKINYRSQYSQKPKKLFSWVRSLT